MADDAFTFPKGMGEDEARRLLAEAYASIDEGKLLRRTNKLLRKRGIDPPMDVQYAAEPTVEAFEAGLGVTLGSDILIYEPFPEMDDCVAAFEEVLNEFLMARLDKAVRRWRRRRASTGAKA